MKTFFTAVACLFLHDFYAPAQSIEEQLAEVKKGTAAINARMEALEKKVDALLSASNAAPPAAAKPCPCTCGCGTTGKCVCGKKADAVPDSQPQAQAPQRYVYSYDGGQTWVEQAPSQGTPTTFAPDATAYSRGRGFLLNRGQGGVRLFQGKCVGGNCR